MGKKVEELTLQELFLKATGLTWDIQSLITACGDNIDAKKALMKKLVWMIPDGAAADLAAREGALAVPPTKTLRIVFVEKLAIALGLAEAPAKPEDHADLSQVFIDLNEDGDVDAYDAVTVDDSTDSGSDE